MTAAPSDKVGDIAWAIPKPHGPSTNQASQAQTISTRRLSVDIYQDTNPTLAQALAQASLAIREEKTFEKRSRYRRMGPDPLQLPSIHPEPLRVETVGFPAGHCRWRWIQVATTRGVVSRNCGRDETSFILEASRALVRRIVCSLSLP